MSKMNFYSAILSAMMLIGCAASLETNQSTPLAGKTASTEQKTTHHEPIRSISEDMANIICSQEGYQQCLSVNYQSCRKEIIRPMKKCEQHLSRQLPREMSSEIMTDFLAEVVACASFDLSTQKGIGANELFQCLGEKLPSEPGTLERSLSDLPV